MSIGPVDVTSHRFDGYSNLLDPNSTAQRAGSHDIARDDTPRLGITRHYTSLREHADAVLNANLTPGGGKLTMSSFIVINKLISPL